ncbi:MAG: hypothetical protein L0H55_06215 [Candidatus Nitrosocosmicus sp.]|nr:hypothetical protein [Candidatus Nitrosocosmicus sp.]
MNHQTKIWLVLISLWVINGSSFLAIKVAIDTIPPLLSAGLRFSIAGAILFTIYFLQVNRFKLWKNHDPENSQKLRGSGRQIPVEVPMERITLQQWKDSIILGVTLFLGGQGLLTWGAQYLT